MLKCAGVKLIDLLNGSQEYELLGRPSVDITSLSHDSRFVSSGSLFFCVPGLRLDGHDFAGDALARGAAALCVERRLDLPAPQVIVPDVRRAMADMARVFYGDPSSRLLLAGVTGTNGKTTTAYLTAWILEHSGIATGLLGTVERIMGGEHFPTERTTPEALDLQRDLAAMLRAGDEAAVMEVSSHALELGRVDGLHFDAVAFTNLTQDHLDFHGSFEAYQAAKVRLFTADVFARARPPAVVNLEDPLGCYLAEVLPQDRLLTYAVADAAACGRASARDEAADQGNEPDLTFRTLELDAAGLRGALVVRNRAEARIRRNEGTGSADGEREVWLEAPLLGRFNAANVLAAIGLGIGLGLDLPTMIAAVRDFPGVPGRMQSVDVGQPFTVLVDYAHTPDSVENVLLTARAVTDGRVIAVLGCGGDRDPGKRPLMGRALELGSDVPVITSDNPRTEDPQAITSDILAGLSHPDCALVQVDRERAIGMAIGLARAGDIVLILGKGHERTQEFANRKVPFDDVEVARSALRTQGWGRG